MYETILEVIGYISSAIVLVSFLMSSAFKLRLINLVGAGIFTVYAALTHSYPTAIMNLCIVIIDIYYLVRMSRHDTLFSILPASVDGKYLAAFLKFYENDIQKYFPSFKAEAHGADIVYFVHCNMITAGVLLGKDKGDGTIEIVADYSTPAFRDCSVGKFLYKKLPDHGVNTLTCSNVAGNHDKYMTKMGFVNRGGTFVKEL